MSHKSCCVVSCKNTGRKSACHFYTFPTASWKINQRKKLIAAVRRQNIDGSLWTPKAHDYICSDHFIGGQKSDIELSPSYIPTKFPTAYKSRKVNELMVTNRFKRLMDRRHNKNASSALNPKPELNELQEMITEDPPTVTHLRVDQDCQVKFDSESDVNFHTFQNMTTEETSEMQNITLLEDNLDIKIEANEISLDIKLENENVDAKENDNPFQNVQLEVKEEIPHIENDESIKDYGVDNIKIDEVFKPKTEVEHKVEEFTIKLEQEQSDPCGEYPEDDGSMDIDDAMALHNVEACLEDDVKTEGYEVEDNNVNREEIDLGDSETNLISNKFINTSTVTTPCLIESETTKTLIMEVHPMIHSDGISKIADPEVILPTSTNNDIDEDPYEDFQLNSITGDILPLEHELLQAKKRKCINNQLQFVCPKCPKVCNQAASLKRHLSVHDTIERRALGIMKGKQTRIERKNMYTYEKIYKKQKPKVDKAKQKIRKDRLEKRLQRIQNNELEKLKRNSIVHEDNNINIEIQVNEVKNEAVKKEGYVCVCGEAFKRKSRMETCRRSHDTEIDSASHSCVSCSKQFRDKEQLVSHRKRLHRKRFPCKFCPTDYNTRKELFKHLQLHQEVQLTEYKVISEVVKGKKMKCFMCKNTYTELSDLKCHVMEEHKQPYICQKCNENFNKIIDFCNHTKTNHPEIQGQPVLDVLEAFSKLVKAWKCEECELQFHEADKLAKHQIEQHSPEIKSEAQFQCLDCHRMFVSQKGLTSHARIHHSIEDRVEAEMLDGVMCVECRKICKDMDALTSHMRLHSPERKYPCKFCDFRFTTPEKRKAHAEIHTGDMKFVCFICEYQCSSENRLKQHKMSLKHANMKEFLLTGKPLLQEPSTSGRKESKDDAKKRKKDKDTSSDDEAEVMCDICGEKFSSKKKMLKHKDSHPFIEFPNEDTPTRIFFK